jgi:hypothetical protein
MRFSGSWGSRGRFLAREGVLAVAPTMARSRRHPQSGTAGGAVAGRVVSPRKGWSAYSDRWRYQRAQAQNQPGTGTGHSCATLARERRRPARAEPSPAPTPTMTASKAATTAARGVRPVLRRVPRASSRLSAVTVALPTVPVTLVDAVAVPPTEPRAVTLPQARRIREQASRSRQRPIESARTRTRAQARRSGEASRHARPEQTGVAVDPAQSERGCPPRRT